MRFTLVVRESKIWFFNVSRIAVFHLEHVENHFPSGKNGVRWNLRCALNNSIVLILKTVLSKTSKLVEPHEMNQVLWKQPEMKKMDLKPEVVISQHWNDLAPRFQRLHIRFRCPLVQWSYVNTATHWPMVEIEKNSYSETGSNWI